MNQDITNSHLHPLLIIHAGNMLTGAHPSTEIQRTDWLPALLLLLYHTDFLHKTVLPEFTSKDPCVFDNMAGWRV